MWSACLLGVLCRVPTFASITGFQVDSGFLLSSADSDPSLLDGLSIPGLASRLACALTCVHWSLHWHVHEMLNLSSRGHSVCAQHEAEGALDHSVQTKESNSLNLWQPSWSCHQSSLLFSQADIAPYWQQDVRALCFWGTGELLKSLSLQQATFQHPPWCSIIAWKRMVSPIFLLN